MAKKRRSKAPSLLHAWLALAALCAVAVGLLKAPDLRGNTALPPAASDEMTIEHESPVTISLAMTEGRTPGLVDIWHDDGETVTLTLPSSWRLREVQGGGVDAVPRGVPADGRVERTLPPGIRLSFLIEHPAAIVIHNNSAPPLQIRWSRINLETGKAENDSVLVKSVPVELW